MKPVVLLFLSKLFTLVGAILNTVGVLTFFFWVSLEPYRWKMIIGGLALIIISELIGHLFLKKMIKNTESVDVR